MMRFGKELMGVYGVASILIADDLLSFNKTEHRTPSTTLRFMIEIDKQPKGPRELYNIEGFIQYSPSHTSFAKGS